jgi:hypothetical protein
MTKQTTIGPVTVRIRADLLGRADWSLTCRSGSFPEAIAAILAADEQLRQAFTPATAPESPPPRPTSAADRKRWAA